MFEVFIMTFEIQHFIQPGKRCHLVGVGGVSMCPLAEVLHGAGVIVSQLLKDKLMEGADIPQLESFKAGLLFARTEGIIPAPESCHAIAAAIREANRCKQEGKEEVLLFNLSGHGLIDMSAYDQYLSGSLQDYVVSAEDVKRNLDQIEKII